MRAPSRPMLLVLVGLAAACMRARDDRTAVELERDATHQRALVAQAEARQRVSDVTHPLPSGAEQEQATGGAMPQQDFAAGRAARAKKRAERDERDARRIRDTADAICAPVPASQRATCPVPSGRVERVARGVRITGLSVEPEALRAQLACADALAQVERPVDADQCPLRVPGVAAHVVDSPTGAALELIAPDDVQATELRRRVGLTP